MDRRNLLSVLTSCVAAAACGARHAADPFASATAGGTARRRLQELAAAYEQLMATHGLLQWQMYAGVKNPGREAQMRAVRADEQELFAEAQRLLEQSAGRLVSPRQHALWTAGATSLKLLRDPEALRLSDALEQLISEHRFKGSGGALKRADLTELRTSSTYGDRLEVRRLYGELHKLARPLLIKLLTRRNAVARAEGQRSYYEALLRLRGVDPGRLDQLTGALRRTTRRSMQILQRQLVTRVRRRLAPWDMQYALETALPVAAEEFPRERAIEVAREVFAQFGFDLGAVEVRVRDFAFGGQAISVRVPDDVRVVVRPQSGHRFLATLLHEFGHAFVATATTETAPLLKGYEWIPGLSSPGFAEGQAEVFGRLLDAPNALRGALRLAPKTAAQLSARRRAVAVVHVRRLLGLIEFERRAYEDPAADLDALSLHIERQALLTYTPRGVVPVWAASPFHASYPVYRQSYLVAAMMSVQVRAALQRRFASNWISRRSGRFIRERLVASGVRWTTDEHLVRATGQPLHPGDLVKYLTES